MSGAATNQQDLRLFIPLTKVDIEKRLVYGVATAEDVDLAGEVCDYESTKPNYAKWSENVKKASGGRSLGNLRSMHGSTAAGKIVDIDFNDDAKAIEICAKVVDDNEWQKVQEGVYTGFSQGGRYAKRWTGDDGRTYYTADPSEVSLVDLPCLPSATFSVIKAGEAEPEMRKFVTVIDEPTDDEIKAEAETLAGKAGAGHTWHEFAEAATTSLFKGAMTAALNKLIPLTKSDDGDEDDVEKGASQSSQETTEEDKTAASADAKEDKAEEGAEESGSKAAGQKAKKWFEPTNKWDCGCADHTHITKAEAVGCMKKRAAEEEGAKIAAPAQDALAKLEEELGLGKAKAEKQQSPADAHREAADQHTAAAELHEGMAAHEDASASEAKEHLAAASAHHRAAEAHQRAAGSHDDGDEDADDRSEKAGAMTRHAAGKSDAIFVKKGASADDLAKYNEAEARDEHGRWTGSGSAHSARHEATSVTTALAQTATAMGVGMAAGHAGGKIGAKVGAYAGKALALAATRNRAAAEGGKVVGEKVGRVVGHIAGAMYGEARAWAAMKAAPEEEKVLVVLPVLEKGLSSVGRLANLIQDLFWLQRDCKYEADAEKDNSPLPGALETVVKTLNGVLVRMAQEETDELFQPQGDAPMALAAGLSEGQIDALIKISETTPELEKLGKALGETQGDAINRTIDRFVTGMQALVKVGARNSAVDADRLQKCHDLLKDLGAMCKQAGGEEDGEDEVEKLRAENSGLKKSVEDINARLGAVLDKVAELGKRAAPAKAFVRAVEKGEDDAPAQAAPKPSREQAEAALKALTPQDQASVLMKVALANPVAAIR